MPSLFDTLPTTLFNPLVSPGAPLYVEVLLALLEESQRHNQPLSRESALFLVQERLADDPAALTLTADAADAEEEGEDEEALQARAGALLRYLKRTGWLREETQADYTRTLLLPDYAFRLLRTLQEIAGGDEIPLAGLICAIHDLLQAAARDGNAHLRLPEAHRQTLFLINALKELQHNIGQHIERVLQQAEARQVLQQLFFNYREEIVDQAYHQLRTTDHVSRFRPAILQALTALERGEGLESAAQRLRAQGESESVATAIDQLLHQIREIRARFERLDRLLDTIDLRHSQFVDSAVRTVELHLSANSSTSGQLHAILSHLLTEEGGRATAPLPDRYAPLLNLFQLSLLDPESLATPTRAAIPFEPEIPPPPTLSEAEIAEAQAATLHHMLQSVSRERVRHMAAELLRERAAVPSAEIPLDGPDDLPLLIYLRAYGDGSLGYLVDEAPDAPWIERAGVGFRAFTLRRPPTDTP